MLFASVVMSPRQRSVACRQLLMMMMMMMVAEVIATTQEEDNTETKAKAEGTPSEFEEQNDRRCPELDPYVASPCAFLCGNCQEGEICCRNTCGGTQCMEPAKPHIPTEKERRFWKLYEQSITPLKKSNEEKTN